jgi:hypothetical protein
LSLATFPRGAQRKSIRWWRLGMNDCGKNDLYYAQHADRIVHLFDGLIVEEETGAQRLAAGGELKESGFRRVSLFA